MISPHVRHLISSRLGWILFSVQLTLILFWFGLAQGGDDASLTAEAVYTGRFIGGRFVELNSALAMTLVLVNAIPLLIAQGALKALLLILPSLSVRTLSWVQAAQLLAMSSLQSLMAGCFVERMIKLARMRD